MNLLVGIKKGMTRVFVEDKVVPVTVLDISNAVVTNMSDEGIELGVGVALRNTNKALEGKYKTVGSVPQYRVWIKGDYDMKIGDKLSVSEDVKGKSVDIVGISKGKGFAGVVKRWGFHGGQRTHGQSDRQRAPGAIGAGTDPGRVLKGKRMGGRMGGDRITVKNKNIIDIKDNYLLISGAVPGNNGSVVTVIIKE